MIKSLLLSSFLFYSIVGFSQPGTTIDYQDQFGPLTMTYVGLVNGQHSYSATDGPFKGDVRFSTVNNRWEVLGSDSGGPEYVIIYSDLTTAPNPPNLTIGNYQVVTPAISVSALAGTGTTADPLPVTLLYFNVEVGKSGISLAWQTAQEVNNAGFYVQRSTNAVDWESLEFIVGAGDSEAAKSYQYLDRTPPSSEVYYRLKQLDLDDAVEYHEVLSAIWTGPQKLNALYPNPARSQTVLLFNAAIVEIGTLEILDSFGRVIESSQRTLTGGVNLLPIEVSGFPVGTYVVRVHTASGEESKLLIVE